MNWITQVLNTYNEITRTNPLVATLALPLIGGIMFYLKDVPKKLLELLVEYTTVTMSLNNAGYDGNLDAYNAFDKWFMQSGYRRFSKKFFMFRQYKDDLFAEETYKPYRLGIGNGLHMFFYKGKFFWFTKERLESGGSEKLKEEISIYAFGWNFRVFEDLVDLFNEKRGMTGEVMVHHFNREARSWEEVGKLPQRNIDTFCMNAELKADIINKITEFLGRREWYRRKGLTYKITSLFQGPPGTGKTTLVKLLAVHFKRDLYVLDLADQTNASLPDALSKIKPGSFLLLEDVDQAGGAVKNRKKKKELADVMADMNLNLLTMSGYLNAFDGVVSLDNLIIFKTTNCPEDLDEAVKRDRRIDHEFTIGELTSKEIWTYMLQMYELDENNLPANAVVLSFLNSDIRLPGCQVENAFIDHPEDHRAFLEKIVQRANARVKLAA